LIKSAELDEWLVDFLEIGWKKIPQNERKLDPRRQF